MKQMIDLTKENFDRMDFTEAKIIDFFIPRAMPDSLEFTVWGAAILLAPYWEHEKDFLPPYVKRDDLYVSGVGTVKLNGLKGGYIEICPYLKERGKYGRSFFAKNMDGTELIFRREWNYTGDMEAYPYLWETVITWPYGSCCMSFSCESVSYTFDDKDLVLLDDYLRQPKLYGLKDFS